LRLLRDRSDEFAEAGVRLYGVSRDSPYSHRRYSEQQWLTFPLLSDWSAQAVRAFGVSQTLDGLEDTPVRSCFLIDADGIVRAAWRYGNDEVPDVDELLTAAHAL
jgi:peroxiredoxin